MFIDRNDKCTYLIDIASTMDRNVVSKQTEKIEKHLGLSVELQTLWNTRVVVVLGALGSSSSNCYF